MTRTKIVNITFLVLNVIASITILIADGSVYVNPLENNWIPIIGLAYPVLLLANIAFIIIWLVRRKRWFLISLVSILLGFSTLSNFFQINFYEEVEPSEEEIKILTYNVRLFGYYDEDGGKKRDGIFNYLVEEAADIMCFQEFYHTDNKKGFITRDRLVEIQDAKYLHEKYTHEFRYKQNFGVVTLSKYPIVHKGYIPFDGDINNFCIYSDIVVPSNDTIRVYNAHLASIRFQKQDYEYIEGGNTNPSSSSLDGGKRIVSRLQSAFEKRSEQINKVLENVKQSPHPTFLVGDFNDSPISYCYSRISEHLNDAFLSKGNGIGNTYNGSFPSLRIDYVFHSDNIECVDFNVDR
ncbi:MAG: endonuclease/exonuclease/phosphatase family metal-dependent hydrolase, partial [Gammaproteobacteria bacterium]